MTNFNLITFYTSRMILFIIVFIAFALDDCHVAGNTTVAIAKVSNILQYIIYYLINILL